MYAPEDRVSWLDLINKKLADTDNHIHDLQRAWSKLLYGVNQLCSPVSIIPCEVLSYIFWQLGGPDHIWNSGAMVEDWPPCLCQKQFSHERFFGNLTLCLTWALSWHIFSHYHYLHPPFWGTFRGISATHRSSCFFQSHNKTQKPITIQPTT